VVLGDDQPQAVGQALVGEPDAGAVIDCGELEDLLPEDRRWLEESRAALAAELGRRPFVATCVGFVFELGRMLVGRPEIRTAATWSPP
jgi:hypothetical protein